MPNEYVIFVGVDWATERHQICVLDAQGKVGRERSIEHSGAGLRTLVTELGELGGEPGRIAVAIETPRGPVVEALLEAGIHVYSINPKQLDRFRDRHTIAGAKDDRRDAFVLADSLRTDRHLFRRVALDDPLVIQLREIGRAEDTIKKDMSRATNQLRDLLLRYFPAVLPLCPAANEAWFWELLGLVKTPERAATVHINQITRVLKNHRIRRITAKEVREVLRQEPLRTAPGVVDAAVDHVSLLLPRLRVLRDQLAHCEKRTNALLEALAAAPPSEDERGNEREHRDVEILQSLPGVGRVVAATMLAEASEALRNRDYYALRTQAGVAPVTKQTGKQTSKGRGRRRVQVGMRYACSARLREAVHCWAQSSATCDAWSKAYYAAARARGHTHGRALRGLADRLLQVLVGMLKSGTTYDAAHRRAA